MSIHIGICRFALLLGLLPAAGGCIDTAYGKYYAYAPSQKTPKEAIAYFIDFVEKNDAWAADLYFYTLNDRNSLFWNLVLLEATKGRLLKERVERQFGAGSSEGLAMPMLTNEALAAARRRLAQAQPVGNERVVVIDLRPEQPDPRQPPMKYNLLQEKVVVRLNRLLWQIDVAATFPEARITRPFFADDGPAARRLRQYADVSELSALISQGKRSTVADKLSTVAQVNDYLRQIFSDE